MVEAWAENGPPRERPARTAIAAKNLEKRIEVSWIGLAVKFRGLDPFGVSAETILLGNST
jgi:hypothetical protein